MGKPSAEENRSSLSSSRRRSTSITSDTSSDSDLSIDTPANHKIHPTPQDPTPMIEGEPYRDLEDGESQADEPFLGTRKKSTSSSRTRRVVWILGLLCVGGWVLAFVLFMVQRGPNYQAAMETPDSKFATGFTDSGKPITLDQVLGGQWLGRSHGISWIAGANGEDGLLLEQGESDGKGGYLRVEDIENRKGDVESKASKVLMEKGYVVVDGSVVVPYRTWPSADLNKVLLLSNYEKNWRHSYTGKYWILDVESQTAQPLDPGNPEWRVQLAIWSPTSDAVVFVRDNNMYLRKLSSETVIPVTKDGGKDLFYGVPDWVYEEEVFSGNSVTWWSNDGKFVAYLRTDESNVPEYTVQYFLSRPSGKKPLPGLERYPDVSDIKYPKAGAPNPVVNLQFYDVEKDETFSVEIPEDFPGDDRIIMEVLWASGGNVLIRTTNRESDILKVFLINTETRTGKLVRLDNVAELDGGWVEPSQSTRFIPADPNNGRPTDGYIETVVHEGYDHLAYFAPLDNSEPLMLTSGEWEVVDAPSAVDLKKGLVYFVAAKEAPTQRHVYSVKLDGTDLQPLTDISRPGYFDISFSDGTGYALVSYKGPSVPWQAIMNTKGEKATYQETIEENKELARLVQQYALPTEVYSNVTIDGFTLQTVERRPPHFNPAKQYPVLFHLYGGPGSQTVDRKFNVDFQSYIASNLGYIVVTVDGRGTGFIGRKARCIVRGNLGYYEAHDQIETAKIWAAKPYVDASRLAIWGWSYGGFMTLKTIEQDAGQTFQYGMAVAPVTDWRFYDSIYTERYMHTPDHNPNGYDNSSINDMSALQENVRFTVMHGVSDDNVHLQNTLILLDKLDVAGVENYDVHFFPDSDHSIYFHNAHKMVYDRLSNWLVNAFNGEWHTIAHPVPEESIWERAKRILMNQH
ncbi:putative dipeptidyl-aminopeptidase B [Aspergillus cristatus]|uniref:dipeptidyl-peptidase IV n=1 Tax=Aspergillus cristatus TaxID=573508 RepID=A0A1E3B2K5_ASPCR|nr:putative dipeptidyl-aminopeptidase B [Aspergillus cristatus]